MANSQFYQFTLSKDAALTLLSGSFIVGASGAVASVQGSGIENVVRTATGTYEIQLSENYTKLIGLPVTVQRPDAATDSGVKHVEVAAEQVASASAPKATIILSGSTVAVDPATGSKIMFTLVMRNSSVKGKGE